MPTLWPAPKEFRLEKLERIRIHMCGYDRGQSLESLLSKRPPQLAKMRINMEHLVKWLNRQYEILPSIYATFYDQRKRDDRGRHLVWN